MLMIDNFVNIGAINNKINIAHDLIYRNHPCWGLGIHSHPLWVCIRLVPLLNSVMTFSYSYIISIFFLFICLFFFFFKKKTYTLCNKTIPN